MRTSHRLHIVNYYTLTAPRSLIGRSLCYYLQVPSITLPFLLVVQHSTSSCLSSLTILAPTLLESQTRTCLNSLSNDLDLHAFASKVLGCWAVILEAHWLSHRLSS